MLRTFPPNPSAHELAFRNCLSEQWAATLGEAPGRVDQLYLRALGRFPAALERDQAESFATEAKSLVPLVQAIFNPKESSMCDSNGGSTLP